MIRYALRCERGHGFESWFADSSAYEGQRKRKLIECPNCGSSKVEKAVMAPALKRGDKRGSGALRNEAPQTPAPETPPDDNTPIAMVSAQERELRTKLKELRDHLVKNADYVGPRFPEEARKMHHGEIDRRSIYGEASVEEAKSLAEDGVEFHPLPILPEDRN